MDLVKTLIEISNVSGDHDKYITHVLLVQMRRNATHLGAARKFVEGNHTLDWDGKKICVNWKLAGFHQERPHTGTLSLLFTCDSAYSDSTTELVGKTLCESLEHFLPKFEGDETHKIECSLLPVIHLSAADRIAREGPPMILTRK